MIRPKECIVELKCLKDTKMNYEIKELEKLTLMHDVISKNICCFCYILVFISKKIFVHALMAFYFSNFAVIAVYFKNYEIKFTIASLLKTKYQHIKLKEKY